MTTPLSARLLPEPEQIRTVVDRIDNAVDRKDWILHRSYFTGDVHVNFRSLTGGGPVASQ
jgi:hypothetical protein